MKIVPITLRDARKFIASHHRHNIAPRGWRFGVGLEHDGELIGVAVAGRPVARLMDDGVTIEVTRVATLGRKNASTMLYGAICRAATNLGYQRVITYTLETESGISLRAAGMTQVGGLIGGRSWASEGRGRYASTLWGTTIVPAEKKIRWERSLV